jgi:hypothetical protein
VVVVVVDVSGAVSSFFGARCGEEAHRGDRSDFTQLWRLD